MNDLFGPIIRPARKKARVMMHVIDAGASDIAYEGFEDGGIALYKCGKCGHESVWTPFRTISEAKRGMPCPKCNQAESGEASADEQARRVE